MNEPPGIPVAVPKERILGIIAPFGILEYLPNSALLRDLVSSFCEEYAIHVPVCLTPSKPNKIISLKSFWLKPSAISTARLNPLQDLHVQPIKQIFYLRPYSLYGMGSLILGWASHLDAFSAYPFQT